jgi:hypothetical protein
LLRKPSEDVGVDRRRAGTNADATTKTIRSGFPARMFGWLALFTMRYSGVSAADV